MVVDVELSMWNYSDFSAIYTTAKVAYFFSWKGPL